MTYDFIVIGAGIVGVAATRELLARRPDAKVLLLEKESAPGRHQTAHNSGVVHAGVYYEPGSLKARFCRQGVMDTETYCRHNALPFERTGKLLVATDASETERMDDLFSRCRENGLDPERLDAVALAEMEPRIRGLGAILVRDTAITDYPAICRKMLEEIVERGCEVKTGEEVTGIEETPDAITVTASSGAFSGKHLLVCGGLMADRLAKMQGIDIGFRTVPFRGEYYRLHPRLDGLVKHLVYPIPDPSLPFLGVHLTRMVDGTITVGPNAVQGWKREGYGRLNFSPRDTLETLLFPGFWKMSLKYLGTGVREYRDSLWKRGYLERVRKYCPEVNLEDLLPYPAGVRAQAMLPDGALVHDFLLERTPRSLHVCNAPSPAATSAIPIARHLCDVLFDQPSSS